MAATQVTNRRQAEELLIEKARTDEVFRRELIANPSSTISKTIGVQLPPGIDVTVVEESARQVYLVLPASSAGKELSDEELAAVAGGGEASDAGFGKKLVGQKASIAQKAAEATHRAETL